MNNDWIKWLKENVNLGVKQKIIVKILIREGFSDEEIMNGFAKLNAISNISNKEIPLFNYNNLSPIEMTMFCDILRNRNIINEQFKQSNIVKINNFFTKEVADFIYTKLENTNEWKQHSTPYQDAYLDFSFNIAPTTPFDETFKIIAQLFPNYPLFDISIAKYSKNDGIQEHSDTRGYIYNNEKYCRHIAMIIYFNKKWKTEYGGLLHDVEKNKYHLPLFNTAIFFKVPYRHAVTKVIDPNKCRYSIFGWFSDNYHRQYHLNDNNFSNVLFKY